MKSINEFIKVATGRKQKGQGDQMVVRYHNNPSKVFVYPISIKNDGLDHICGTYDILFSTEEKEQ